MKRTVLLAGILLTAPSWASRVEIRHGRFYVDHEPFYVRGIGYAPWRPHQIPGVSYASNNRRWTELDFARMKAAHFNTIRTWQPLEPEELDLANRYGLMVLQGIWLDPRQDFSDPHNQQSAIAEVRAVAEQSKAADNILGYLVMTEPWPEAVVDTGEAATLEYFRRLKRAIQEIDPRPVSVDSWTPLAFMDYRDFDFVTFNHFAFWPASLNHALGFEGVVRWLVNHHAADRPLIIGETGGYSVSLASTSAAGGSGGHSEYDQSLGDLESLRGTVQGHASGSVLVSWIDTWHYPKDPDTHDNEPWEWDGLLGIPTDSPKDMDGIPRRVLRDVTRYNEIIVTQPKEDHFYPVQQLLTIEAFGGDNVAGMRFNVNDGDWKRLEASGHGGFHGEFKLPKLAKRRQALTVEALDEHDAPLSQKRISFLAALEREQVLVAPSGGLPEKGKHGLHFSASVTDGQGHPISHRKVYVGCFCAISFAESQATLQTNDAGQTGFDCTLQPSAKDLYLFVAAGTDSPDRVRSGDMRIFKLGR